MESDSFFFTFSPDEDFCYSVFRLQISQPELLLQNVSGVIVKALASFVSIVRLIKDISPGVM